MTAQASDEDRRRQVLIRGVLGTARVGNGGTQIVGRPSVSVKDVIGQRAAQARAGLPVGCPWWPRWSVLQSAPPGGRAASRWPGRPRCPPTPRHRRSPVRPDGRAGDRPACRHRGPSHGAAAPRRWPRADRVDPMAGIAAGEGQHLGRAPGNGPVPRGLSPGVPQPSSISPAAGVTPPKQRARRLIDMRGRPARHTGSRPAHRRDRWSAHGPFSSPGLRKKPPRSCRNGARPRAVLRCSRKVRAPRAPRKIVGVPVSSPRTVGGQQQVGGEPLCAPPRSPRPARASRPPRPSRSARRR